MRLLTLVLFLSCLAGLAGCSNIVAVIGKVTFSDGSPLTKGTVCFQNEQSQFTGSIASNGEYVLINPKGKGIPKGDYRVSIHGAVDITMPSNADTPADAKMTALIAKRFMKPEESGLTCSVTGSTVYDITVEKP